MKKKTFLGLTVVTILILSCVRSPAYNNVNDFKWEESSDGNGIRIILIDCVWNYKPK